jgi:hypothetical protein
MPPELVVAPFEPWRRRTATAGPGLGLSIAKGIVEAHSGRIEMVHTAAGTHFRVHLPIEAPGGAPGDGFEPIGGPDAAGADAGMQAHAEMDGHHD